MKTRETQLFYSLAVVAAENVRRNRLWTTPTAAAPVPAHRVLVLRTHGRISRTRMRKVTLNPRRNRKTRNITLKVIRSCFRRFSRWQDRCCRGSRKLCSNYLYIITWHGISHHMVCICKPMRL